VGGVKDIESEWLGGAEACGKRMIKKVYAIININKYMPRIR
jgi:hypothetical protein